MNTLPIADVLILDRQRKTFIAASLNELANSIEARGLLHAVILRNDSRTLVCGERRVRAAELLYSRGSSFHYGGAPVPVGYIPYITLANLSETEVRFAELEENVVREDLTMAERVHARAALDRELETRAAELGERHTYQETANVVFGDSARGAESGAFASLIKRARLIDDHLNDPEVAKATSESEAMKIVTRKLEREFNAKLAARGATNSTPHTLLKGDAYEHMIQMPDRSFDVILADPPYGIGADEVFGDMAQLDHDYRDDREHAMETYHTIAKEGYRLTKSKAHAYAFLDLRDNAEAEYEADMQAIEEPYRPTRFQEIAMLFQFSGWEVWPWPLIWMKGTMGLEPHPGYGPRRSYEAILFARKGDRPVTGSFLDTIPIPNIKHKLHAAQKPTELYVDLLRRSTRPGDTVLDPTCGSGTIFLAADALHLQATGIELDETAYNLALQRMTRGDRDE